jgi:hypothetical protein
VSDPNVLYYGDNLDVLERHVKDETIDLVYLDPPFNSNADYNVLFEERGEKAAAQPWRLSVAVSGRRVRPAFGGERHLSSLHCAIAHVHRDVVCAVDAVGFEGPRRRRERQVIARWREDDAEDDERDPDRDERTRVGAEGQVQELGERESPADHSQSCDSACRIRRLTSHSSSERSVARAAARAWSAAAGL